MVYIQSPIYVNKSNQRGRIRCLLAGLVLGILIALAVIYGADGPFYTTSEIDAILAARV